MITQVTEPLPQQHLCKERKPETTAGNNQDFVGIAELPRERNRGEGKEVLEVHSSHS